MRILLENSKSDPIPYIKSENENVMPHSQPYFLSTPINFISSIIGKVMSVHGIE